MLKIGLFFATLGLWLAACTSVPQPSQSAATPTEPAASVDLASLSRHDLLIRTWVVQMAQVEARMTFKSDGTLDQELTSSPGATQIMQGRWELKNNDTQLVISYGTSGLTWDIVEMSPQGLRLVAAVQPGTNVEQTLTLIPQE
ncbi:MAG: hypothetical protein U0559_07345 [Anaerolineae bacterium]